MSTPITGWPSHVNAMGGEVPRPRIKLCLHGLGVNGGTAFRREVLMNKEDPQTLLARRAGAAWAFTWIATAVAAWAASAPLLVVSIDSS